MIASSSLVSSNKNYGGTSFNGYKSENEHHKMFDTAPFSNSESMIGKTIIVAFSNYRFRLVGVAWYERMTQLGYENHLLVATDSEMVHFLREHHDFRYQVWLHEPMPEEVKSKPKNKQDHAYLELLMAVRWKYLLHQLENGIHVVLTDVDNIFNRFLDVDKEFVQQSTEIDVWHAYATKFPRKAFGRQGFVVCSGMSWWRSSSGGIRFAKLMQHTCGDMCDDQRILNELLTDPDRLNMTWHWTETAKQSKITNATTDDPRFLGLPTIGISGESSVTEHKARIWDREFAFRGPILPVVCPSRMVNWVSMPILEAKSRQEAWKTKLESFLQWDRHCNSK